MLPERRKETILAILAKDSFAQVPDLAKRLGVSEMTVRRDLDRCEQLGLLTRVHGGATIAGVYSNGAGAVEKASPYNESKHVIAKRAAGLVGPGMSVFLDFGTTCREIGTYIQDIPDVTLITNDVCTAHSLMQATAKVILIGGEVQRKTGYVLGAVAQDQLSSIMMDVAFIGAMAVNAEMQVMARSMEIAYYKRQVCKQAATSYLVADSSKFGAKSLVVVNNVGAYTAIITDKAFTTAEAEWLTRLHAQVLP